MLQHLFFQFLNFLIICIFFKFGRFHDGVRAGKLTTEWDVAAGILFIVCGIGLLSALIAVFIDYMSFLTTMRRRNVKDSKQLIKYFFVQNNFFSISNIKIFVSNQKEMKFFSKNKKVHCERPRELTKGLLWEKQNQRQNEIVLIKNVVRVALTSEKKFVAVRAFFFFCRSWFVIFRR